jgi:hypothetical protein
MISYDIIALLSKAARIGVRISKQNEQKLAGNIKVQGSKILRHVFVAH